LQPGQTWTLNGSYLGYEWDIDTENATRPQNLIHLSSTTVDVDYLLQEGTVQYAPGTPTHNLTLYQADSGALVFSAGSVFWSWALDDFHVYGPVGPYEYIASDPNAEQAMVNLFAEMGVQPGTTLAYYLVPAQQSSDRSAPSTSIINLYNNQKIAAGDIVTIEGVAPDVGGGATMVVEVSTDGGATWNSATGVEHWSYTWEVPTSLGSVSIMTRSIDDKANMETAHVSTTVSIVDPSTVAVTPVSQITNFIDWNLVDAGSQTVITGAAVDPDGGWVGGVEFSADNGQTWTAADGTGNWSYTWTAPTTPGFYTLLYRSGDNDLHQEAANAITLSVVTPGRLVFGGGSRPKSSLTNLVDDQKIAAGSGLVLKGTVTLTLSGTHS